MEFIEAPAFSRYLHEYLDDDGYREMQGRLAQDPKSGEVIPGAGGFRKVRWADTRRGKGRRGGLRVIYYYLEDQQQIWLMTLYGKDEAADLTTAEKKTLKAAMDAERRARQAARRER